MVLLACTPLASSSKPNARTMVREGLKFFSSKVSTDELLGINLLSTVREEQNTYKPDEDDDDDEDGAGGSCAGDATGGAAAV